ncbi:hypothetical protein L7F22_033383 [Adiantum nelumboides]|nr:hypothetical protein [Adiantum nelumboides]
MRGNTNKEVNYGGALRGLPVLLQEHERHHGHATLVGCVRDKSKTDSMEQTLNYIFNVGPGHPAVFKAGDEFSGQQIQASLQQLLRDLPSHEECGRDGLTIMNDGSNKEVVDVDKQSVSGDLKFMRGGLVLESQAAFSSVRSNACVSKGKWMYEVTLETAGIQQLGWATRSCSFTREEGVGDSADSYAYDGRRVRKWSVSWHPYGQPWVPGDVIGCCINLDKGEISFLRNGVSLGVAFTEVGHSEPKFPYFPAISLSQGERCDLNLGGRPLRYPAENFQPLQAPPLTNETRIPVSTQAKYLLGCLQRLLQLDSKEVAAAMPLVDRLRRLKPLGEFSNLVGKEICKTFVDLLLYACQNIRTLEYVIWGAFVPFLMELYRFQPPHDVFSVDTALNLILSILDSSSARSCIGMIMEAVAYGCRTSSIVLAESPFTGSYPYLALAIHLLRRDDVLMHWCKSGSFEVCLEGLLSKKGPNKYDLEKLMPTVWWPGSREDSCTENNMRQTSQALTKAMSKVEELQWELSYCLLEVVPNPNTGSGPSEKSAHPSGSIFMSFLRHLVGKNRGAARNMPPPGLSDNSVLMTAYTVLLHFLSEGVPSGSLRPAASKELDGNVGFLHRGGTRSFNVRLFLDADSYASDFARLGGTFSHLLKAHILAPDDCEAVVWEEGCMEDGEKKVTHSGKQKPCCCPGVPGSPVSCSKGYVRVLNKGFNIHVNSVSESSGTTRPEQGRRSSPEDEDEKPCSSGRVEPLYGSSFSVNASKDTYRTHGADVVQEEELLDIMVLLYHLGVAPNFKQVTSSLLVVKVL